MINRKRDKRLRLVFSTILAFILHIIITQLVVYKSFLSIKVEPQKQKLHYLRVSFLNKEFERKENKKKKIEYDPPEKIPQGQIVNTLEGGVQKKVKTKYISLRDQYVEKETRARIRTPGVQLQSPKTQFPESKAVKDNKFRGLISNLAYLKLPTTENGDRYKLQRDKEDLFVPESNQKRSDSRLLLYPTLAQISKTLSGTGLDFLEDVEEGDETLLSTNEWKYASFFLRVKQQIEQNWHPDIAFLTHDPTGRIYGYKDRETVVKVVLYPDGSLKDTFIIKPSGAPFLDREAVRAIKAASPFPNPPKPLIDPEKNIIVFNCAFLVEVGSGPILRIKRY